MTTCFVLIFTSALFLTAIAGVSLTPTPSPQACVADLVAFSPCFGFVSSPPNNVMDGVDPQCCKAVTEAFSSGGTNCFCHLMKQPLLFGFPLNATKIASLPSLCIKRKSNATSAMVNLHSLEKICAALPPVPSSSSSVGVPTSSDSGSDDYTADKDPPTESTEAPAVSGGHNKTLAPMEPPAESGKPSPAESTESTPVADTRASSPPASSIATELGATTTWFLYPAAFPLLMSLV